MADKAGQGQTALITGASSGIGLELARCFAAGGFDLVLVARRKEELDRLAADLAKTHGIKARTIAKDLSHPAAPAELFRELKDTNVDVLVNNAGFATYGPFAEIPIERELQEIQLNVTALTHLSKLFVAPMLGRKRGRILNVASTAAFQPGPLMAVYYATKAYVLSFSEAIATELQGSGVTVTALCPGPTESGFQSTAKMEKSKLVESGLADSKSVAEAGYKACMKGKAIIVPGMMNKMLIQTNRVTPRAVVRNLVKRLQETRAH